MRDRHTPTDNFTFGPRRVPGVYFPPRRFNWALALRVAGVAIALGATLALLTGCETMQQQQGQQQIDPAVLGAILGRQMSQPVQLGAPYAMPMQQPNFYRPQVTCTRIGANVFCN